jgi:hypothetical protein
MPPRRKKAKPKPMGISLKYFLDEMEIRKKELAALRKTADTPEGMTGARRKMAARAVKSAYFTKPVSYLPSRPAFIGTSKEHAHFTMVESRVGIEIAHTDLQTGNITRYVVPYEHVPHYELA